MAPEVGEEEGSYVSRFYRWFLESFKSCLLLLIALPGLIDTLAQLLAWRSLLWLSMTWRRGYLTQNHFLSTTSLVWSLALHLLFCSFRRKEMRWKEINIPTHTQSSFKSSKTWEPNQSSKCHSRVRKARTNVPQPHFIEKCNSDMGELISLTVTWIISSFLYKGEWYIDFTVTCIRRKEYSKLIFFVM